MTGLDGLELASGLVLPLEVVTQSVAILARRGAGKSFTARRLAELLIAAGLQVVIVDPKGDHWGIRSARDGKRAGLPVVILGGEHGDVPLEAGAGEVVARLVAEERATALLDLSLLRKGEVAVFMSAFLEGLYRLKAREQFRTPMMLILDEADAVAPQRPQHGEERMLGAAEDIVRRGRQRGLGCTLVTQRAAVLNKNVLTQAEVLVLLRTIGPQDLAALDAWIDLHGTPEQRRTLMGSLPSLPVGEAWIWSPGWPSGAGIFQRGRITHIETFDSGATPKPGEKRIEPKHLADVDLGALRRQMAATIERAKAGDPQRLRARVAELERELAKKAPATPAPAEKPAVREVPVFRKGEIDRLLRFRADGWKRLDRLELFVADVKKVLDELGPKLQAAAELTRPIAVTVSGSPPKTARGRLALEDVVAAGRCAAVNRMAARPGTGLAGGERRILTALAQYSGGRSLRQVALLTGYAIGGGGFNNYIGALRSRGLLEGGREALRITDAGLAALGEFDPLPQGQALLAHWLGQLGKAERAVLSSLASAYPKAMAKDQVAAAAGYAADGGGFNNALGRLRTLELIEGRGELRASAELFE
jgi:hypothetical protein